MGRGCGCVGVRAGVSQAMRSARGVPVAVTGALARQWQREGGETILLIETILTPRWRSARRRDGRGGDGWRGGCGEGEDGERSEQTEGHMGKVWVKHVIWRAAGRGGQGRNRGVPHEAVRRLLLHPAA